MTVALEDRYNDLRRIAGKCLATGGSMQPRFDFAKGTPGGVHAMLALTRSVHESGLARPLLDLVFMRASQINGCAYCIDMHSKDARAAGETEQRLYALDAWRETSFFSERERAALAWTEALTNVQDGHASDEEYEAARKHFDEKEMSNLTLGIATINAWNRIAIATRAVAGSYQVQKASGSVG
jgi:AhpD family alkylhydroperoxidase